MGGVGGGGTDGVEQKGEGDDDLSAGKAALGKPKWGLGRNFAAATRSWDQKGSHNLWENKG